jgi:hypothetical protein
MRRIRIDELKSGMIVAHTIMDCDGRILLRSGIQLNENYIKKLSELGHFQKRRGDYRHHH